MAEKNIYSERLKIAIVAMGFKNVSQFIEHFDLNRSTIYAIITRGKNPSADTLSALAKTGINMNWLITGEGDMLLSEVVEMDESFREEDYQTITDEQLARMTDKQKMQLVKQNVISKSRIQDHFGVYKKKEKESPQKEDKNKVRRITKDMLELTERDARIIYDIFRNYMKSLEAEDEQTEGDQS